MLFFYFAIDDILIILLFDDYEWEMNGMKTKLGIDRFLAEYAGRVELLVKHWQLGIRVTA